jgi:hypothetical protein
LRSIADVQSATANGAENKMLFGSAPLGRPSNVSAGSIPVRSAGFPFHTLWHGRLMGRTIPVEGQREPTFPKSEGNEVRSCETPIPQNPTYRVAAALK